MQVATDSELAQDDDVVDIEDVEPESAADDADGEPTPPSKKPMAASWRATLTTTTNGGRHASSDGF